MVKFEGVPYPITIVYLKLDNDEVLSIPFVEALDSLNNLVYDHEASKKISEQEGTQSIVIHGDTETAKNKTYAVTREQLMRRFSTALYNTPEVVVDMAIQPEDELMTDEVQKLIAI